jgi:hypothetical protein
MEQRWNNVAKCRGLMYTPASADAATDRSLAGVSRTSFGRDRLKAGAYICAEWQAPSRMVPRRRQMVRMVANGPAPLRNTPHRAELLRSVPKILCIATQQACTDSLFLRSPLLTTSSALELEHAIIDDVKKPSCSAAAC